jgi:pyruvate-formate lyase-activating enzyme
LNAAGEVVSLVHEGAMPLAAVLPPGYARTWLPAYEQSTNAAVLPLFGYAAVGSRQGRPVVAAMRTDEWLAWDGRIDRSRAVRRGIEQAYRTLPDNRMIPHLQRCATDYRCLTAQHLFQRDGEGALPVSPACNAACLGCISEQWGDVDSPQERMSFAPTSEEIAELAAWHLSAATHNFVSFGQGCEGEPLTRAHAIAEAIRRMRRATSRGSINVNTNGSLPRNLELLIDAGLDSCRISLNSAHAPLYEAYYRPVGYSWLDVERSIALAKNRGVYTALNLLTFPGVTDEQGEAEALCELVSRYGVDQVQMRSLAIDPEQYLAVARGKSAGGPVLGMRALLRKLRVARKGLLIGNFARGLAERQ